MPPSPWIPTGGGGGGVTAVTGTPPIASSGGATPDISIDALAIHFPPIQYTYWVGKLPLGGTQIGSVRDQFITLSDAVAAAAALPVGSAVTYLLADKSYAGDVIGVFKSGIRHIVQSLCGGSIVDTVLNVPCTANNTELTLIDIIAQAGIGLTGDGTADLTLIGTSPGSCTVFTIDDSLLTGGAVTIKAQNANYIINGPTYVTSVKNVECILGSSDFRAAQFSHVGGAWLGTVNYFQLVDRGVSDVLIFGHVTCGAASAGFLAGFQTCLWNSALAPARFTGPVGSFTTDIESAYSFGLAGGSLVGGATSNFTDAGYEGYELQILGGVPTFVPPGLSPSLVPFMFGEKSIFPVVSLDISLTFDVPAGATIHVFCECDSTHDQTVSDDVDGSYGPALLTVNDVTNNDKNTMFSRTSATGGLTTITATATAGNAFQAIAVFIMLRTGAVDGFAGQLQVAPGTGADAVRSGPASNSKAPAIMVAATMNNTASVAAVPGQGMASWLQLPGGGDGDSFTPGNGQFMTAGWGYGGLATARFAYKLLTTVAAQEATFRTQQPTDDFATLMAMYPAS